MGKKERQVDMSCCSPKPRLEDRPLLNSKQAVEVEELFKLLGNQTRLRILHLLVKNGEMRVTEIAQSMGMTPQTVSNQLQRLAYTGVLDSRRVGVSIHYRIIDPCVPSLLNQALCLLEDRKGAEEEAV